MNIQIQLTAQPLIRIKKDSAPEEYQYLKYSKHIGTNKGFILLKNLTNINLACITSTNWENGVTQQ